MTVGLAHEIYGIALSEREVAELSSTDPPDTVWSARTGGDDPSYLYLERHRVLRWTPTGGATINGRTVWPTKSLKYATTRLGAVQKLARRTAFRVAFLERDARATLLALEHINTLLGRLDVQVQPAVKLTRRSLLDY